MKRKLTLMVAVAMALALLTVLIVAADGHLATVSVGHGIPGDDLGMDTALPVDVDVSGACAIEGLEFGEFYDLGAVAPGTYSVTVHVVVSETEPACSGPAAIGPLEIEVMTATDYTVFAHLALSGTVTPTIVPTASVFVNDLSDTTPGHARATIRHTAAAPEVDVELRKGWHTGQLVGAFEDFANGDQIGPVDIRPGAKAVAIFPAGGDEPVFTVPMTQEDDPFVLKPHKSTIVYAVGSLANETFQLMVQQFDIGHNPPPHPVPPE